MTDKSTEEEKRLDDQLNDYMNASEEITKALEEGKLESETAANQFWDSLSYDDKCNAFHAVVSKLFEGEIRIKGSYRYVLYDVFGFGPDMYIRGMDCGYMALHNSIMTEEQFNEANAWMCDTLPKE
jgi:hypothetical protein